MQKNMLHILRGYWFLMKYDDKIMEQALDRLRMIDNEIRDINEDLKTSYYGLDDAIRYKIKKIEIIDNNEILVKIKRTTEEVATKINEITTSFTSDMDKSTTFDDVVLTNGTKEVADTIRNAINDDNYLSIDRKDFASDFDYYNKKLEYLFLNDGTSNKDAVNSVIENFKYLNNNSVSDVENILKSILKIKEEYSEFKILLTANKYDGVPHFLPNNFALVMPMNIDATIVANSLDLFHESIHVLHAFLMDFMYPDNWLEIRDRARINGEDEISNISEYFREMDEYVKVEATEQYYKYFRNEYGMSVEEYKQLLIEECELYNATHAEDQKDVAAIVKYQLDNIYLGIYNNIYYDNFADMRALSDMFDSFYSGKEYESIEKYFPRGHPLGYYDQFDNDSSVIKMDMRFIEQIAQYSVMKNFDTAGAYGFAVSTFGNEWADLLEGVYQSLINFGNDQK